jgi:hypothetical protein|tara:strand:- start:42166 stop:42732 length:567 start_codon:yes stop_codon:yes gene_type:complete
MKKFILILGVASFIFTSCSEEKDPFLITSTHVGHLTKETRIKQLDSIFEQDSIVKTGADSNFLSGDDQIEIYEKGGAKLLLLSPKSNNNPEATISNVQIFDERYKTDKGLHLNSTFKDLKDNYTITSILNTMNSVVISLAETDLYITIDKEKLPEEIRNQFGAKVEAKDIPDNATFKFLMVGWENENN